MLTFLLRRLAQVAVTLALLLIGTFVVLHLAPGGPALILIGPDHYTPEREAVVNAALGLDRPLPEQLARWGGALLRGELGYSYFHRQAAQQIVWERLPNTLLLGGLAWTLSLLLGIGLGAWAAASRGGWADRLIGSGAVVLLSTPAFWLGIALICLFAAWLRLLPSAGMETVGARGGGLGDRLAHLILPVVALAAAHAASLALYVRAATADALGRDFMRTARAKGLSERSAVLGHALRNAAIPIATIAGLNLPHLIEGAIVIESVFAWPGVGALTVSSVTRRDYPVLMVITLLTGLVVVLATTLTDLVYHALDPRLGYD